MIREHENLMAKYSDTIERYRGLLTKIADERTRINGDLGSSGSEFFDSVFSKDDLTTRKAHSAQEVSHLEAEIKIIREEMQSLGELYSKYLKIMREQAHSQEQEIKSVNHQFQDLESQISKLNIQLKENNLTVNEQNRDIDRENAININLKLSKLIDILVEIEKKRRESQGHLESGVQSWSAKLKLWDDEAARKSREAARDKANEQIDELLAKLKRGEEDMAELNQIRDNLETKLASDSVLDSVRESLNEELEGVNLKIRWANDEKKKLYADLENAIRLLDDKNAFIEA